MKIIIKIAKLELGILFFSPIAWFLAIIFFVQCALAYTELLTVNFQIQDLGGSYAAGLSNLTQALFGTGWGIVPQMMKYGYLYLPLLTMGLVSREISSGTIKLLYSSPVRVSEIVIGKYGAIVAYNFLLTMIVGVFVILGIFNIRHADTGQMLSGLLGTFLLLCTYAAIGLFMSCLTSYQVVAALSTLVILALLEFIGRLWQGVDVVRDITFFFSMNRHIGNMVSGLITSNDVLYFVLISLLFLGFSMFKLRSQRESKPLGVIASRYIGLIIVFALAGYLTSRPRLSLYFDATANKDLTLTKKSQEIIKKMGNGVLEINSYVNLLDWNYWSAMPEQRQMDMLRWQPYVRFKPDIKFNYVYYWDAPGLDQKIFQQYPGQSVRQIAEHYSKSMHVDLSKFKTPEEIAKIIDLKPEGNGYVRQLKYDGKTTWLRMFADRDKFPSEQETDAALERLLLKKFPKVAFLDGESERAIDKVGNRDYSGLANTKNFRFSLINQGFDVMQLTLDSQEIPNDIAVLIIADPRVNFSAQALTKIRAYISAGGNLMIAGEAGKQVILNPLLNPLGVSLMDGMLVERQEKNQPSYIYSLITKQAENLESHLKGLSDDSAGVSMPKAVGLSYSRRGPFTVTPLLMTDARSTWNKKGILSEDSISVAYNDKDGDQLGSLPTALALTRQVNGKQQRIFISGDADFPSNGEIAKGGNFNFFFAMSMFAWLNYDQFPLNTSRPKHQDNRLNMTEGGITRLKILFLGVIPGLMLVCAAVFLIRRKRK